MVKSFIKVSTNVSNKIITFTFSPLGSNFNRLESSLSSDVEEIRRNEEGKFKLPILTFIDTPGAYPGIDAEERNQSGAIAQNLQMMSQLKTPIISTIIGEGGSGGALAIGVADRILMLQYSVYSVISPEGCASILWKSAEKASEAAEAMAMNADRLYKLKLIDAVIQEPLGGAHTDFDEMANQLKIELVKQLAQIQYFSLEKLLELRYNKILAIGV